MSDLYSKNKVGGGSKPLNKGFTLVELLVIIAVLGMILLIAIPIVGKVMTSTKNKAYDEQIELIYQAMEYHVTKDTVEWKREKYELTLEELSSKGYIKTPIKDPRESNTNISKNICIVATKSEDEVVNYSIRDYCERTSVIATVDNITNTSMEVEATVKIYDGVIEEYYFSKDDGKTWSDAQTSNIYEFVGLTRDTEYKIKVKAIDNEGNATLSPTVTVKTTNESVPIEITEVVINNKTSSSMTVIATGEPAYGVKGYYFSKDDGKTWSAEQKTNTYTFTGLTKATTYPIKVKIISIYDEDTISEKVNATTSGIEAPTYEASTSNWTSSNIVVTITYPSNKEANWVYEYKKDEGAWTTVTGTSQAVTFTENGYVIGRIRDTGNDNNTVTASLFEVTKIDKSAPTIASVVINATTSSSIKVVASASDTETGIKGYYYSKNNGTTWTTMQTTNTYTFTGLTRNTTYPIKVKVANTVNQETTSSTTNGKTTNITPPTYTMNPNPWGIGNATVTIKYPTNKEANWIYEYQKDGGSWTVVSGTSQAITFTVNGSVRARITDGINTVTASTFQAVKREPILTAGTQASYGPYLKADAPITKDQIESIEIVNHRNIPSGVVGSYDVSAAGDGSVMLWYKQGVTGCEATGGGECYKVYIGGAGGVYANPNSSYLFSNLPNLISLNLQHLDTSKVTNMSYMFSDLLSLPSIELGSRFVTTNVTNMSNMFSYMANLTTIVTPAGINVLNFDTSKVTDMSHMFSSSNVPDEYALKITSLEFGSQFVTNNVVNMSSMFMGLYYLTIIKHTGGVNNVINFNTSKVTSMSNMFYGTKLSTLELGPNFVTNNVTNMNFMFSAYLTTIKHSGGANNVLNLNTSKVTSMFGMFAGAELANIEFGPNFVTSNVTDMSNMLNMHNLTTVKHTGGANNVINFDTSKVTNMSGMFAYSGLASLELGPNFNTSKVTEVSGMFRNMTVLSSLNIRYFSFSMVNVADTWDYRDMFTSTPRTVQITVNSAGNNWLNTYGYSAWNNRVIVP